MYGIGIVIGDEMNIIYSREYDLKGANLNKSIFLAGPTPRSPEVKSWRPEFINNLTQRGYDGTVFVPEDRDTFGCGVNGPDEWLNQVEWEDDMLNAASIIVFWIPRDLETLPGFTTNVEFGRFINKKTYLTNNDDSLVYEYSAIIYGRPPNAPKTGYLDWLYYKETGLKPFEKMDEVVDFCVDLLQS